MSWFSGKKKAHKLLTHKLSEKAVNPGTTSRLTRRKRWFFWVRRRAHRLFCPVNRPVVPGSTGPSPEQKVYVCVPFPLPSHWAPNPSEFAPTCTRHPKRPKQTCTNPPPTPLSVCSEQEQTYTNSHPLVEDTPGWREEILPMQENEDLSASFFLFLP